MVYQIVTILLPPEKAFHLKNGYLTVNTVRNRRSGSGSIQILTHDPYFSKVDNCPMEIHKRLIEEPRMSIMNPLKKATLTGLSKTCG
jgi:hypothetical protein